MKRLLLLLTFAFGLIAGTVPAGAADAAAAAPAAAETTPTPAEQEKATTVAAAAAAATAATREVRRPDFLEHVVDSALDIFDVRSAENENTVTHFVIAGAFLLVALLARRLVALFVFRQLKRVSARTHTTFDDKLFPALEAPSSTFIMLVGIFAALNVLKLNPALDRGVGYGSTVAFTLVVFWGLLRAFGALLDQAQEIAAARRMGVAAFMPWIKKTLITLFAVLAVLMVIQSLGFNVRALLAGLGIGGLAFALAAQDTLANIFGSIVVAIDQPFRLGEFVQIGPHAGAVEDIGLRSTKLRRVDKSLIIIPNKTVAAEAVTNLARFTRRRNEQVIQLTYDTKPGQMEQMVQEIHGIITSQPEVDANSVMVYFRDLNTSSLDIWVVYETPDPDFQKHMQVKQRINLAIMRAVEARGLAFAFPTQTVQLAGEVAEKLANRGAAGPG